MRVLTEHTSGVGDELIQAHLAQLVPYATDIRTQLSEGEYTQPESSLYAPFDTATIDRVEEVVAPLTEHLRTVLLVGIGGSDLGTRAIYDALGGHSALYTNTPSRVRLHTFGTVETNVLARAEDILGEYEDAREIVLVVISKSGTTVETLANANILYGALVKRFGTEQARHQTLVITDPQSALEDLAHQEGIQVISMPKAVGGRYSVFTTVGIVPLALLGVDIRAFCEGGRAGVLSATKEGNAGSVAMVLASILFEMYQQGVRIHETFLFDPALETLGKWYRQLLAESVGKQQENGTRVGIMPTIAIGSVDLHSLGQLVFGGPRDRFTTFVSCPATFRQVLPLERESPFTHRTLEGVHAGQVMEAIYEGVKVAYTKHNLPYISIEFSSLDARELGACMTLQMTTVMYLASLLSVNAFDQPNVEAYKHEARKRLVGE